ncbi:aspartyl protease family protein [Actomonas aquatica]|uniref:Aspartyl protease family protein n=1 Tax=Actomonas aquatica TaxID=2866162 RepID=A0ABZ1CFE3_9BACT|nr:aspartyl protease family protein [Opitutus sp. WL0086]WRQ90122.1 aspartyl protease family protein [Opitutus sp. WL0086]
MLLMGPVVGRAEETTRQLPVEWCGRHMIVTAWVGGDESRPLALILDTGATHTVIDPDALRRVSPDTRLKVGQTFRFERLDLGEVKIRKAPGWLMEVDEIGHTLGRPIDGILGYPTLKSLVLTLDYPARGVWVTLDGGGLQAGEDVMRLKRGRRRPWIDLELAGRKVPVLVDSGSSQGFTVHPKDRVTWAESPRIVSGVTGFEGVEPMFLGRLGVDLQLGSTSFTQPIVRAVPDNERALGARVLEHFVVTVDGPGRRIRFARPEGAGASTAPITEESRLGLGLGFRSHADALEVAFLQEGGPAARAGIQLGDRVVAIDGVPVAERGCGVFLEDEESRELRIERNGETDTLTFRLERAVMVP